MKRDRSVTSAETLTQSDYSTGVRTASSRIDCLSFGPDFFPPLIMGRSLWFTIPFLALALSACSSSSLPRVKVAKNQLADVSDERSESGRRLVQALQRAEAASSDLPASRSRYNAAVEAFVLELQRRLSPHDWTRPVQIRGKQCRWQVSFDDRPMQPQGNEEYAPARFDRILPANRINTKAFTDRLVGDGLGAPVVLALEKELEALSRDRAFRPGNGLYVPATALLEFGKPNANDAVQPVRLRFANSYPQRKVTVAGQRHPLAYNYTSVIQASLDNPYLAGIQLSGLLRPDRREKDLGVFGLIPYDPAKIPVVFVHGLGSVPSIWRQQVNAILADPVLSRRYQPLLFIYPTGISVPGAAARLRQSLIAYRQHWDPDQNDTAFNRMVIVGHSMGGLLARLQVIDTGEELRRAFFTRPIHENDWMDEAEKRLMHNRLVLQPLPFVDRVVFIAVPHRGSKLADIGLVQLAVRLIKLPTDTLGFITQAVTTGGEPFLNPELHRYRQLGLRSVDMLSPKHPYFTALERCKITVPCHSIIGDRGKGPGPKCSDGVVPYWSSHLDSAASEKNVPHWHGCVEKPETVAEVLRILRLHLRG